ncbi:MAG: hypothetical protein HY063_08560 [Bacteroidetes bacterium]|nr:hypothetical protein [Bacteroidota bacterium]
MKKINRTRYNAFVHLLVKDKGGLSAIANFFSHTHRSYEKTGRAFLFL